MLGPFSQTDWYKKHFYILFLRQPSFLDILAFMFPFAVLIQASRIPNKAHNMLVGVLFYGTLHMLCPYKIIRDCEQNCFMNDQRN